MMTKKTIFFVVVGCSLIVASNVIYTGTRFAIHEMDIHISAIASSLVAGLMSLLAATGALFGSKFNRKFLRSNLIVFKEKGGNFIFVILLLLSALAGPGYFIALYNVEILVQLIDKELISIYDGRIITMIVLYAIYITFIMFMKINSDNTDETNTGDSTHN